MTRLLSASLAFVAAVVLVMIGYWIAGFDFDERGEKAFGCYFLSLMTGTFSAIMAALFPGDGDL